MAEDPDIDPVPPADPQITFDWENYIRSQGGTAAPASCFYQPSIPPKNDFQVNHMMLGYEKNSDLKVLTRVVAVHSIFIQIHIEGLDNSHTRWILCDDNGIGPLEDREDGQSTPEKENKMTWTKLVYPPTTFPSGNFKKWLQKQYAKMKKHTAPPSVFKPITSECLPKGNTFVVGHKLAAFDDHNFDGRLAPATVVGIEGLNVKLHFDGWESKFDITVKYDARCMFPIQFATLCNMAVTVPRATTPQPVKKRGRKTFEMISAAANSTETTPVPPVDGMSAREIKEELDSGTEDVFVDTDIEHIPTHKPRPMKVSPIPPCVPSISAPLKRRKEQEAAAKQAEKKRKRAAKTYDVRDASPSGSLIVRSPPPDDPPNPPKQSRSIGNTILLAEATSGVKKRVFDLLREAAEAQHLAGGPSPPPPPVLGSPPPRTPKVKKLKRKYKQRRSKSNIEEPTPAEPTIGKIDGQDGNKSADTSSMRSARERFVMSTSDLPIKKRKVTSSSSQSTESIIESDQELTMSPVAAAPKIKDANNISKRLDKKAMTSPSSTMVDEMVKTAHMDNNMEDQEDSADNGSARVSDNSVISNDSYSTCSTPINKESSGSHESEQVNAGSTEIRGPIKKQIPPSNLLSELIAEKSCSNGTANVEASANITPSNHIKSLSISQREERQTKGDLVLESMSTKSSKWDSTNRKFQYVPIVPKPTTVEGTHPEPQRDSVVLPKRLSEFTPAKLDLGQIRRMSAASNGVDVKRNQQSSSSSSVSNVLNCAPSGSGAAEYKPMYARVAQPITKQSLPQSPRERMVSHLPSSSKSHIQIVQLHHSNTRDHYRGSQFVGYGYARPSTMLVEDVTNPPDANLYYQPVSNMQPKIECTIELANLEADPKKRITSAILDKDCNVGPNLSRDKLHALPQYNDKPYFVVQQFLIQELVNCALDQKWAFDQIVTTAEGPFSKIAIDYNGTILTKKIPYLPTTASTWLYIRDYLKALGACQNLFTFTGYRCEFCEHRPEYVGNLPEEKKLTDKREYEVFIAAKAQLFTIEGCAKMFGEQFGREIGEKVRYNEIDSSVLSYCSEDMIMQHFQVSRSTALRIAAFCMELRARSYDSIGEAEVGLEIGI